MKCELFSGVTYYTDGDVCTDIDVAPDIKSVTLMHPIVNIARNTCKKEYSNVEELIIRDNVTSILIPNKMFPNVKKVSSKSKYFSSGKYLIKKFMGDNLLNAFGQSEGEYINFGLFEGVTNYAFDGCKAKEICNYDDSKYMSFDIHAFDGSGFLKRPFIDGLKRLGSLVIDIDSDADEIVIPDEKLVFAVQKNVKCVRIKCINSFNPSRTLAEKVIIEDERLKVDDTIREKLRYYGIKEIESCIPRYKTADGIIYSADMTTLIACPQMKTGKVVIPEGVKRIRKAAFSGSKISGVVFPDSLEKIEAEAFYGCENLEDIDFGHGIEQLGADGKQLIFSGCAFERLVFPSQIKEIGVSAFYACHKLKEIVFNEGLEKIAIGAFKNCMMLREVNLPASIRELGKSAFVCIPNNRPYVDLHINMTTIPDNLVKALVYCGSLKTLRCIYVHIDNANGVHDFVLPDSITSIRNGYSEIALEFNMLADTQYMHNTRRLETAFHYAASSRYECIVAYKTYLKTKHKAAKEFLEKEQYRVAAAIIEELDEKDFVNFVKLRCINLEYDSCIMKRLQEKNWNIALAYMLEEGNGRPENALVI